jgi:hypothetical protein
MDAVRSTIVPGVKGTRHMENSIQLKVTGASGGISTGKEIWGADQVRHVLWNEAEASFTVLDTDPRVFDLLTGEQHYWFHADAWPEWMRARAHSYCLPNDPFELPSFTLEVRERFKPGDPRHAEFREAVRRTLEAGYNRGPVAFTFAPVEKN